MEIPVNFQAIAYNNLIQLDKGHRPFVIHDSIYSKKIGLMIHKLKLKHDNDDNFI